MTLSRQFPSFFFRIKLVSLVKIIHPANRVIEIPEWDESEKSILRESADRVTISIRGGTVERTVTKSFA